MNMNDGQRLLEVNNLRKHFPIQHGLLRREIGRIRAVDDVSFYIGESETLGLVGESGCGKTTTARCILRAVDPTSGEILFRSEDGSTVDVATAAARADEKSAPRDADDLSGSVLIAESAHDADGHSGRASGDQRLPEIRARGPRGGAAERGWDSGRSSCAAFLTHSAAVSASA